jgi:PAS domain-containing protein
MALRRDLWIAVGALVALNVLLAFGATGLLVRMGPAIERILDENIAPIGAAEEMLGILALAGADPIPPDERVRFEGALRRARTHEPHPEEASILDAIEAQMPRAIEGSVEARRTLVPWLARWIEHHRADMRDIDRDAKRLGHAGAWAAVGIGIASLAISLVVTGYLRRRILVPIEELDRVLDGVRHGDPHRRCRPGQARGELLDVLLAVNAWLDERGSEETRRASDPADRARRMALLALLDRMPEAALVLDAAGEIAAANARALERLAASEGRAIRATLAELATNEEAEPDGMRTFALRDRAGRLVILEDATPQTVT